MDNFKGFTLVEVLIYSLLLGLIVTGFISFALAISWVKNKNLAIEAVNANANSVLRTLNKEVKQADTVIIPAKGDSGSTLVLSLPDSSQHSFYTDGGRLFQRIGSGEPIAVIDEQALISDIIFYNLSGADEPDNIKILFSLQTTSNSTPEFNYQQSFQTAIGLE